MTFATDDGLQDQVAAQWFDNCSHQKVRRHSIRSEHRGQNCSSWRSEGTHIKTNRLHLPPRYTLFPSENPFQVERT